MQNFLFFVIYISFFSSEVTGPRYLRWFWGLELRSVLSDYDSIHWAIAFFGREIYSAWDWQA